MARVLWMRLAVTRLEPVATSEADTAISQENASLLGQLKTVLEEEVSHEWAMKPVLDHLSGRLAEERNTLLAALVAAIGEGDPDALQAPFLANSGGDTFA